MSDRNPTQDIDHFTPHAVRDSGCAGRRLQSFISRSPSIADTADTGRVMPQSPAALRRPVTTHRHRLMAGVPVDITLVYDGHMTEQMPKPASQPDDVPSQSDDVSSQSDDIPQQSPTASLQPTASASQSPTISSQSSDDSPQSPAVSSRVWRRLPERVRKVWLLHSLVTDLAVVTVCAVLAVVFISANW